MNQERAEASTTNDSRPIGLLMASDVAALPSWAEPDLAELWEHQLSVKVAAFDGVTFGAALRDSGTPPAALEAVVRFAAAHRDEARSAYPTALADALFHSGRLLLRGRGGAGGSLGSPDEEIAEAVRKVLGQSWIDPATRSVLSLAVQSLTETPHEDGLHSAFSTQHSSIPPFHLIEGYEILGPLGAGGMGTVWRARQLATRRTVALKLMSAAAFGSCQARERFEREVELTARLEHPHIARVYDSGLSRGVWFYAMELIEGRRLDDYARAEKLARGQTLALMAAVCRAVQHAHERGVIHRDLKPSNILVSGDGRPHLLDFGMARAIAGAAASSGATVSLAGDVAGTPAFMAPEVFAVPGGAGDTRGDVYSLGVVLYLLVLGRLPKDFDGAGLHDARRVAEKEPARPRSIDSSLPSELEAILLKALAVDPARRYPAAGALGDDLENYLRGEPVSARRPTLAYFAYKRVRRHWAVISGAGAAACAVLFLAVLAYVRIAAERNMAVKARIVADDARRVADEQRKQAVFERRRAQDQSALAEQERKTAQARLADSVLARGDALAQASRWSEAAAAYEESRRESAALGRPTLAADVGLAAAFGFAPSPLNVFVGHSKPVTATAISADETLAVSGSQDRTVRLWDLVTGREIRTFPGHSSAVTCVAISPRGDAIAAGADDGAIRIWEAASGRELHVFRHAQKITGVAFSPDGGRIASASLDRAARVWDLQSGASISTFIDAGAGTPVLSVTFSPDGRKCLSCLAGTVFALWDADSGKRVLLGGLVCKTPLDAAYSSDGGYALEGAVADEAHDPRNLTLWAFSDDGLPTRGWSTHGLSAVRVGFCCKGTRIVSASRDGTMQVWDPGRTEAIRTVWGDVKPPGAVSFAPNSLLALTGAGAGSSDCTMKLWDLGPARVPILSEHPAETTSLAISGDGEVAALASSDGTVDLIDIATSQVLCRLGSAGNEPHHVVALSFDGSRMLEGFGFQVRLWDLTTGEMVTLGSHNSTVRAAAFSPDGRFALSQSGSQINYWDLTQRKLVKSIELNKSLWPRVLGNGIAFSADGSRAVGVNTHGAAMTFQLPDVSFNVTPGYFNDGHVPSELGAAFRPGGVEALNGTGNDVVLWNAFTGSIIHTFRGHLGLVNAVAVSPDGTWAASAGSDATVRIWDLTQRTEAGVLSCGAMSSSTIAITPDGSKVMAVGKDRMLRLWDLSLPRSCRDSQPALERAGAAMRDNPNDPAALESLGRWYALRGNNNWAINLLERARAGGKNVSALMLARCYWAASDNKAAAREYRTALQNGEAPRRYLELCITAVDRASAVMGNDAVDQKGK